MYESKNNCRKIARKNRASHSSTYRHFAKIELLRRLIKTKFALRYQYFGLYIPANKEIDILPCLHYLQLLKKKIYLPQISAIRTRKKLLFSELNLNSKWYYNKYNIKEIYSNFYKKSWQIDVLFMPLLGFDAQGYRLGMGGGYYDATLSYLKQRRIFKKPLRVGVAFENQFFDQSLQFDSWDVPVDYVLTEKKIYKFNQSNFLKHNGVI